MRRRRSLMLCGALWVVVLSGFVISAEAQESAGKIPTLYTSSVPMSLKAGQWIGSEPLPQSLSLADAAMSVRFVYGAADGVDGSKVLKTSGVVLLPRGASPAGGWPIVAWAHGTTGIADRCAPSVNPRSSRDAKYLSNWLKQGFAIVATDYQGLGTPGPHPYLHARSEAYSVLDAIRAARVGIPDLANKVLLVGQSQGAGAAFATAGYAPAYAPDVNIIGTIATGLPNITSSKSNASGDKVDRTIAYVILLAASASQLNPSLDPSSGLKVAAMPVYTAASQLCIDELFEKVEQNKLTRNKTLKPDYRKVYGKLLAAIGYPTRALKSPLFVGTGERDIDVPPKSQLALVREACDAGTKVEAHLYAGLDHSGTVNPSFKDSITFARKVLAGQPINVQCDPTPQ